MPWLSLLNLLATPMLGTVETVFTLADDGRTATVYFSSRGERSQNNEFLFDKDFDKSLVTYARPGNYTWSVRKEGKNQFTTLRFPNTASYAYLKRIPSTQAVLSRGKEDPNSYVLLVDGSSCHGEGCQEDESIISVIIPTSFKVLSYGASVDGSALAKDNGLWKIVDNTYTFYRTNLQGAHVVFVLESAASYGYNKIAKSFERNREIVVYNERNRIRIVMPMDKLFDVGSAEMQPAGLKWIDSLARSVADFGYLELRVEGHTDGTPILRKTQQGYGSNWDLSVARASNIVQFLVKRGLPPQKLAAVGYGEARPLGTNDTPEGRARNRRIEFSIITQEDTAPVPVERPEAETTEQESPLAAMPSPVAAPDGSVPAPDDDEAEHEVEADDAEDGDGVDHTQGD